MRIKAALARNDDKSGHAVRAQALQPETHRVRLAATPRRYSQSYGAPYFALSCADGTVAILLDAETHKNFGALKPGAELTLLGHWRSTMLPIHHCDRLFHIQSVA